MKLILTLLLMGLNSLVYSQIENPKLTEILKQFFITNNSGDIGLLIQDVGNIPGLSQSTKIATTDTSLLYFNGFSSSFNPFSIPVNKIEIQLRESRVLLKGEPFAKDTFFIVQIIGITDSTEESRKKVQQEFRKLSKEFAAYFVAKGHRKSPKKQKRPSESVTFDLWPNKYKFLQLGWGGYYKNQNTHCISLSVFFKSYY